MSIRTLLWAKEQTVITSSLRRKDGELKASKPAPNAQDKLALIAIADEASEHAWDALIGLEDIAVFIGCTRRAARDSLGRLERAGFIRCRHTKVESGQDGWRRIYLLSTDSPLFQGLIDVDFGSVEHISRYQMRTFRDRHKSQFIPSDSLRNRAIPPAQRQGEHDSPSHKPRGNTVPPSRGNTVPPEGEHSSSYEGEHSSSPSDSPADLYSPSDARESAATDPPQREHEDGRTDEPSPTITEEHRATATKLAQQADLSKVGARPSQVRQIADAVATALALGYSAEHVRRHLRAKLREARTVRYVLTGLEPSRLDDTPLAPSRPDNSREDHHAKKRANADRAAQHANRDMASLREQAFANIGKAHHNRREPAAPNLPDNTEREDTERQKQNRAKLAQMLSETSLGCAPE